MKKEQLENKIIENFQEIGLKVLQFHTLNEGFPKAQFDISFEVQVENFLEKAQIAKDDAVCGAFKRFQKYSEMETASRGEKKVVVGISSYLEDKFAANAYVLNNQLSIGTNGEMSELEQLFDIYGYSQKIDKINFVRTFSEDEAAAQLSKVYKLAKRDVMLDRNVLEVEIEQQAKRLLKKFEEGVV